MTISALTENLSLSLSVNKAVPHITKLTICGRDSCWSSTTLRQSFVVAKLRRLLKNEHNRIHSQKPSLDFFRIRKQERESENFTILLVKLLTSICFSCLPFTRLFTTFMFMHMLLFRYFAHHWSQTLIKHFLFVLVERIPADDFSVSVGFFLSHVNLPKSRMLPKIYRNTCFKRLNFMSAKSFYVSNKHGKFDSLPPPMENAGEIYLMLILLQLNLHIVTSNSRWQTLFTWITIEVVTNSKLHNFSRFFNNFTIESVRSRSKFI